MSGYIQENKLLVISDTAMYRKGGKVYAYEPVLKELKALLSIFSSITWIGADKGFTDKTLAVIDTNAIKAVILPRVSYSGWVNKVNVALQYPQMYFTIKKYWREHHYIYTRGPSHPAYLGILLSTKDKTRKYIHKYAGDWQKKNIPNSYNIQRKRLKAFSSDNIITSVNGRQKEDTASVLNIPNPCLHEHELVAMNERGREKSFSGKLNLLFVGNLTEGKSVLNLIEALKDLVLHSTIKKVYIAGDGPLMNEVKKAAEETKLEIVVTGVLNRYELNDLYAISHALVLPSISEGFPKVVAEAAAYGCIPVVTNLSGISTYIKDGVNGLLMEGASPLTITSTIKKLIETERKREISNATIQMSRQFTYEQFCETFARLYSLRADI